MKSIGLSLIAAVVGVQLCLATARAAQGQVMGTEAGGYHDCLTASPLPANVWSLIAFDNAGQPCDTKPDQSQTCNPNATWDWAVSGQAVFTSAPGYNRAVIELQLWNGYGGGSCYGGTGDPIFCDNPATHFWGGDWVAEVDQPAQFGPVLGNFRIPGDPGNVQHDLVMPWEMLFYQIAPGSANPASPDFANYSGFWLFAKPLGRPATCKAVIYHDLVYEDGPNS
jgi:hypothetical protein